MHEDVKWFIGLMILFGAIWFAGGSVSKIVSQKPFIEPLNSGGNPPASGGTQIGQKQRTQADIQQSISDARTKAEQIKKDVAALEVASHASPLSGKLTIGSMTTSADKSINEYLVLQASSDNTDGILITGLRLASGVTGRSVAIPKGAYLPFQNQVNKEEPVYLAPGERAYIITGKSPLGMSFRLNECTGFYNQFQTFNPSLPSRCPRIANEPKPLGANQYNDACLEYLDNLSSCQIVITPPASISPECGSFVTKEVSYTKCVERHKNDVGFYDKEWRIYLGRTDPLWKTKRELINVLDTNGKVIDTRSY